LPFPYRREFESFFSKLYQPYLDIAFFYYLIVNMMFLSAPFLNLEAIDI